MHEAVSDWVAECVAEFMEIRCDEPPESVLEVGSRDVNGSVRNLFPAGTKYVGIDLYPGPGVDVIGDFAIWQPDQRYDMVICLEVLEHAENWRELVAAMVAAVADGGWIIVTAAGVGRAPHSGIDGGPLRPGEYYGGIDFYELREEFCKAFENQNRYPSLSESVLSEEQQDVRFCYQCVF